MQKRTVITLVRIGLAVLSFAMLTSPIPAAFRSVAYYKGQALGKAAIAFVLLIAAIPWGRPPEDGKLSQTIEEL